MSTERDVVVDKLFKLKQSPTPIVPNNLFTIQFEKNFDAAQVFNRKLHEYNLYEQISLNDLGLFSLVCTKRTFSDLSSYRVVENMWHHQPFLVYGRQGWYKKFKNQGYKTYKIIDYSFDDIPEPHLRLEALLEELEKLSRFRNYDALYKTIYDTTEHNFKFLLKGVDSMPVDSHTQIPKLNTLQKFRNLL